MNRLDDHLYDQQILAGRLADCEEELLKILGYKTSPDDQNIRVMVRDLIEQAQAHMAIRVGYRRFEPAAVSIGQDNIKCGPVVFECNATVAQQFQGATHLLIFAGTLGQAFDDWSRSFFSKGDPFSAYIADLIGSLKVEQAIDWLSEQITSYFGARQLGCTNRYSPGYCGWDVYEQHKLFSLLPEGFLSIILHPSALMTPIKSVSGIVGAGKNVQSLPYTCAFCDQENCFMRRGKNGKRIPVRS